MNKKKLPPNQAATYLWPSGNRYQMPQARSYWINRPGNLRWKCNDCGAEFREATQAKQMEMHCFKLGQGIKHKHIGIAGILHHTHTVAQLWNNGDYRTRFPHESTTEYRAWLAEDET